jgi:hypothetical protein
MSKNVINGLAHAGRNRDIGNVSCERVIINWFSYGLFCIWMHVLVNHIEMRLWWRRQRRHRHGSPALTTMTSTRVCGVDDNINMGMQRRRHRHGAAAADDFFWVFPCFPKSILHQQSWRNRSFYPLIFPFLDW